MIIILLISIRKCRKRTYYHLVLFYQTNMYLLYTIVLINKYYNCSTYCSGVYRYSGGGGGGGGVRCFVITVYIKYVYLGILNYSIIIIYLDIYFAYF